MVSFNTEITKPHCHHLQICQHSLTVGSKYTNPQGVLQLNIIF